LGFDQRVGPCREFSPESALSTFYPLLLKPGLGSQPNDDLASRDNQFVFSDSGSVVAVQKLDRVEAL
jgi:hypothetical protein